VLHASEACPARGVLGLSPVGAASVRCAFLDRRLEALVAVGLSAALRDDRVAVLGLIGAASCVMGWVNSVRGGSARLFRPAHGVVWFLVVDMVVVESCGSLGLSWGVFELELGWT